MQGRGGFRGRPSVVAVVAGPWGVQREAECSGCGCGPWGVQREAECSGCGCGP